jgi:hypothetical protein
MSPATVKGGWLRQQGVNSIKLVAALLSGGAAMISIVSYVDANGLPRHLGAIGRATRRPVVPSNVSWVGVAPVSDTAFALGDSLRLLATVADPQGVALIGAQVGWSSDDPSVAAVDSTGTVVARGPGVTGVTVSAGARSARARILVLPRVSELHLEEADSVIRLAEGATRELSAVPRDARGHPVARRQPSWRSADPDVAAVDTLGRLTGVNAGRTLIEVTLDGLSVHVDAEVIPVPASLTLSAGGDQRVPAGQRLPNPVVVQVVSHRGRPVAGAMVRFTATSPGAKVEPVSATSDERGLARTAWTLAETPGRQRLTAEVDGVQTPLTLVAEADPVRATTRVSAATDSLGGTVARPLPEPVAIRVADTSGAALADLPVSWSTLDHGSIVALDARTDSLGMARARWTLGPRAGRQRLRVQVGNPRTLPPLTLVAVAGPGSPRELRVLQGDRQTGSTGAALGRPIVLAALDSLGNGVPGLALHLTASPGQVADSLPLTDASGRVAVRWTLGPRSGAQSLVARAATGRAKVTVTAEARAPAQKPLPRKTVKRSRTS